jgi:hypothetical protein
MPSREQIDAYRRIIDQFDDSLQELATARRKGLIFGLAGSGLASLVLLMLSADVFFHALSAFLGIAVFGFIYMPVYKGFRTRFKKELIARLISDMDPSYRYHPDRGLDRKSFDKLSLFAAADRYHSEDLIEGRHGDIAFQASDVHAESKHRDSKGRTSYSTLFKGEAFVFRFKQAFRAPLYIEPDFAERRLGFLGTLLQSDLLSTSKLVRMDNPAFERQFKVMSEDEINARYILTPRMMEKLLELSRHYDQSIFMECSGYEMHLLLYHRRDKFEPTTNKAKILADLQEHLKGIRQVARVAEILQLEMHHINLNSMENR